MSNPLDKIPARYRTESLVNLTSLHLAETRIGGITAIVDWKVDESSLLLSPLESLKVPVNEALFSRDAQDDMFGVKEELRRRDSMMSHIAIGEELIQSLWVLTSDLAYEGVMGGGGSRLLSALSEKTAASSISFNIAGVQWEWDRLDLAPPIIPKKIVYYLSRLRSSRDVRQPPLLAQEVESGWIAKAWNPSSEYAEGVEEAFSLLEKLISTFLLIELTSLPTEE